MTFIMELLQLLVIVIASFSSSVKCQETECKKVEGVPPCVCSINGKMIDLRSLASNDGTAKFSVKHNEDTYWYNPCYSFTEGSCKDVAGCQESGGKRSMGTQATATFETNDKGEASISYSKGRDGRSMTVNLVCSEAQVTQPFEYSGESSNHYTFTLTTACACPGKCTGQPQPQPHHSNSSHIGVPGLIILSVFFILIIAYFVAGMIILRVKYDRTGFDIIPNRAFWGALPSLVKDGCIFTCTPCTYLYHKKAGGYSKV